MLKTVDEKISLTVDWLRAKAGEAGAVGAVVGISGGIDSAVCAFLIKRAFPEHSLGLILPCKSNPLDREDALKVIETCGIAYREVELTGVHAALSGEILQQLGPQETTRRTERLADANLRSRLRMCTLYFTANTLNYLVVGTGNAAELYTGYFTKYGDSGVDLLPLAGLPKREVRAWAEWVGVPEGIIAKPPTAGLWVGQTDEGEMGTTYAAIDDLLEGKTVPDGDRALIERMHRITEHKRRVPPSPPLE